MNVESQIHNAIKVCMEQERFHLIPGLERLLENPLKMSEAEKQLIDMLNSHK